MKSIQLGLFNHEEVENFVRGDIGKNREGNFVIATLKGPIRVDIGDWIIENDGEISAVKPELFGSMIEAFERKYIYCLECQRNNKAYLNAEGTEFVCDVCGHRMIVDGSN